MAALDRITGRTTGAPGAAANPPSRNPTDRNLTEPAARKKLPRVLAFYLFCVVLPIGFNLGPLLMTSLRGFLIVVSLPLLFGIFSGKYGRILVSDVFFVLYILWATVSLAANSPAQVIQQTGSTGIEFLGGYALGRAHIRSEEDYLALCRALVLITCILVPFAIYETITGSPLLIKLLRAVPGMVTAPVVDYPRRMGLSRVQASFAHPIHFGLFCSVVFSQAFVAMRRQTSDTARYLLSIVIAITGFLSLSAGALLSILLQLGFIAWAFVLRAFRYRWWILVGCFVLAYIVIDLFSNRTPIRVFMSYATFSSATAYYRALIFEWGMKNIWANPILGIGMRDWFRPDYMHIDSVDNFWLLTAMRFGIPGFLLLTTGFLWSIARIMFLRLTEGTTLAQIRLAWVYTFLGLTFTLTTVHIWSNIYSFVFFMFGAGLWMISGPAPTTDSAADSATDSATHPGAVPKAGLRRAPAVPQPQRSALTPSGADAPAAASPYSRFARRHRRQPSEADVSD